MAHLAQNPYFTRAIVNRTWAAFFGTGIINPVDDLRMSNPASNEPLLQDLCAFLIEKRYDLKSLMRLLLQSDAYQRSSDPVDSNRSDTRHFSHYYPRRHMAEVLNDAIIGVTGIPEIFDTVVMKDGDTKKTEFYPSGTRALQLYDTAVRSYFLKAFGRNQREITCECERSSQPSLVQALHLSNGDTINKRLADPKGCSINGSSATPTTARSSNKHSSPPSRARPFRVNSPPTPPPSTLRAPSAARSLRTWFGLCSPAANSSSSTDHETPQPVRDCSSVGRTAVAHRLPAFGLCGLSRDPRLAV